MGRKGTGYSLKRKKPRKQEERGSQERAVDSNVEHHDIEQRTGLYSAVHYTVHDSTVNCTVHSTVHVCYGEYHLDVVNNIFSDIASYNMIVFTLTRYISLT